MVGEGRSALTAFPMVFAIFASSFALLLYCVAATPTPEPTDATSCAGP